MFFLCKQFSFGYWFSVFLFPLSCHSSVQSPFWACTVFMFYELYANEIISLQSSFSSCFGIGFWKTRAQTCIHQWQHCTCLVLYHVLIFSLVINLCRNTTSISCGLGILLFAYIPPRKITTALH